MVMTREFGNALCCLSSEVKSPVSVLLNKKGKVSAAFVGDCRNLDVSSFFKKHRDTGCGIRNYRLITTHTDGSGLAENEKFTLINERLEMVGVIKMSKKIQSSSSSGFELAYPLSPNIPGVSEKWKIEKFPDYCNVDIDIENALEPVRNCSFIGDLHKSGDYVFLAGVGRGSQSEAETSMDELKNLAISAGKEVVSRRIYNIKKPKSAGKTVLGEEKLANLLLHAKYEGAGAIVFDTELAPSEISEIQSRTDMKILDRTQLILEIFSLRASSSEGKIQVRLAKLRYDLPRIAGKGIQMSQLGAGIGTRGPGEKALEKERRQIRVSIRDLERQITEISGRRKRTRKNRMKGNTELVSLVGYTNAGKSTLFSALTKQQTEIADKMFSTLGTKTRRIHSCGSKNLLLTDTVGFIRDLPKDLAAAFRATLEELGEADLLLHVADAGDPFVGEKIDSVESIIASMGFGAVRRLLVFNKVEKTSPSKRKDLSVLYPGAVFVSGLSRLNLGEIIERAGLLLKDNKQNYSLAI